MAGVKNTEKTADDPICEGTRRLSQFPVPNHEFRRASHAFALLGALRKGETWLRIFTYALFLSAAVSIAGISASIILLYAAVLYHGRRQPGWEHLPVWIVAAFLFLPAAAVISALANPDPLGNLLPLRKEFGIFLPLALVPVLALVNRRRLLLTLMVPLVVMAAYAVIQHYWGVDWLRPEGKKLITSATEVGSDLFHGKGAFSHHLTFTGFMLINVPLFLALAWKDRGRRRWIWALGAAAAAVGVAASLGRSGWFGAGIGVILLALGFPRRVVVPLTLVVAVLGLSITVVESGVLRKVISYENAPGIVKRLMVTSVHRDRGRLYSWEAAWIGIRERPLLGVGYSNAADYLRAYRTTVAEKYNYTFRINLGTHTHNVYIQILFELGIVGLVAYVYLWIAVFGWGGHWVRRAGTQFPFDSAIIRGASAGLAGSMVAGIFENNFFDAEVQTMIMMAMGLILHAGLVIRNRIPSAAR